MRTLAQYRGRPIVMTMSYTACRRTCSSSMLVLRKIQEILAHRGRDVSFVVIVQEKFVFEPTVDTRLGGVLHGMDTNVYDSEIGIADGITGMEGNGPLHGSPRNLGRIVLADDPVAADFVCTRLMGLNPLRVNYLAQAAEFLGNGTPDRIVQLGELLSAPQQPFALMPQFAHLRI